MNALELSQAIKDNGPYLVGFIMPLVVEVLNKDIKKEEERYIVAVLACFLIAVALHWNDIASGEPGRFVTYVGLIFLESNTLFKLYFANSGLRGKIQQIVSKPSSESEESLTPVSN